jgi:thiamine-monophosphate kinase
VRRVGEERGTTLADVAEDDLLAMIFPILAGASDGASDGESPIVIGPGDDAAVLALAAAEGEARLVATTDAAVRGRDWQDFWSTAEDVGAKVAAQNLADVAAMGARPLGLLVTLVADPETPVDWVMGLAHGLASVVAAAGCAVVGGDLSSAPPGVVVVSVTALGSLVGVEPVRRSGARARDVVAVAGSLGLAAAGWRLLAAGRGQEDPEAVARQRRPEPPLHLGPVAAAAGATSMIDLSDGLLRDAGRVASASGILLDFAMSALARFVERLAPVLGPEVARECVLAGGEEHSLLATFPSAAAVPEGFRVVGTVRDGHGVAVDGRPEPVRGWDHFGG